MPLQLEAMTVFQRNSGHFVRTLDVEGDRIKVRAAKRLSFVRKADEADVEGRVPMRREQQAVEHVQPLRVALAIGPCNDMTCAQ